MGSRKMMITAVFAAVLMSWTSAAQRQDYDHMTVTTTGETCIQTLIPCQPYLNSTTPSTTCCDALKTAFATQLPCLCAAFTNPALATSFNMTQVLALPVNCGIKNATPSICSTVPPAAGASAPPPPPSTSTPPPPKGNGAAKNIGLAGPVSGLLLLLAGLMFY